MQPVFSSCLREGDADNVDRGGALPSWNHEVSALIGWLAVGAASCYWLRRQEGASHDCHAT